MKLSRWAVAGVAALLALAAPVFGQFWPQWMVNAQHTGTPGVAGQNLNRIVASVVYDNTIADELNAGGDLLVHYQVPLIDGNNVYMEFKTGTLDPNTGDFATLNWGETRFQWQNGQLVQIWSYQSDWKAPGNLGDFWEPVFHATLANGAIYLPGANGSIIKLNTTTGAVIARISPFGTDPDTYEAGPITVDGSGNLFYNAVREIGLSVDHEFFNKDVTDSWLVKVTSSGAFSTASYKTILDDIAQPGTSNACLGTFSTSQLPWPPSPSANPPHVNCGTARVALNIAPALATDGTIYSVARQHFDSRYPFLVAFNPNLTLKWASSLRHRFNDGCGVPVSSGGVFPPNGSPGGCRTGANLGVDPATNDQPGGRVLDDSSSSPAVGPDGSVFYGAYSRYNYAQGHMMKWDKNGNFLTAYLFGWDETPAIVNSGGSYSLVIKDNHYGGVGSYCNDETFCPVERTATNPASPTALYITQLDSNLNVQWRFQSTNHDSCTRQPDGSVTCVANTHPEGFEWCVNGHSVDTNGVVYANSEDGNLYAINQGGTLKQRIFQQLALGAAYTPTSMGSDGKIYSQNKGIMFVVGQ
jgi:hypothetical protein